MDNQFYLLRCFFKGVFEFSKHTKKGNLMRKAILIVAIFCCSNAIGAVQSTSDLFVELISVFNSGTIYVQTNPRHDLTGLTCTSDFWLELPAVGTAPHDAMLATLLAAHHSGAKVIITADDSGGGQFCRLDRVTSTR